jgi:hypothetical protein
VALFVYKQKYAKRPRFALSKTCKPRQFAYILARPPTSVNSGGGTQHSEAATTRPAFPVGVYRLSVGLQPELGIAQRYAEVREGKGLKFVGNVADTIFKVDQ